MALKAHRYLALSLLVAPHHAHAQEGLAVRGSLVDTTGAAIPGASVRLQTRAGKVLAQTTSGAQGQFSLLDPAAGDADLCVPAYAAFAASTKPINVTGSLQDIRLVLQLQSVSQELTVTADKSLSTDFSANREIVSVIGADLRALPIFNQDPIAALTPFLDPSSSASGGVTLIVDGVEMNSLGVSPSAIQDTGCLWRMTSATP